MVLLSKKRVEKKKLNVWGEISDYFSTIGGYGGNYPDIIKGIKEKLDKKGIPFYTQDKTTVEKDGKYIDSIINFPLK